MNHATTLSVLCMFTAGCAEEKNPDSAWSDLAETTEYFQGVSHVSWTGGGVTDDLIARRTLSPASSTMTETFIKLGTASNTVYDLTMEVDVDTNTFTGEMLGEGVHYTSTGTLFGEAWDWHGWESVSTNMISTDDTQTIESDDAKDEDGVVANKTGYDASGQPIWTSEEVLTPITEEEWLALQGE